jgi:hypothetical protein
MKPIVSAATAILPRGWPCKAWAEGFCQGSRSEATSLPLTGSLDHANVQPAQGNIGGQS